MTEKPLVRVPMTDHVRPNLVLAEAVVEHWSDFVTACGPDFPERLGYSDDVASVWNLFALFADQSDAAREATLAYMARNNALSANLLRFYAAVHPRSEGLLELCLRALLGEVGRSRPDLVVEAAETVGEHFGGDKEVLERISTRSDALPDGSRLLVLAEGWPESDELRVAVEDAQARQISTSSVEAVVRVRMAVSPHEHAFETLRSYLEQQEPNPRHQNRAVGSIVRRIRRDPALGELLAAGISDSAPPREIATLPRLLAAAGALTPTTRGVCETLLGRALEGDLVHLIGFDLVEGRRRAVAFALADAIGATPI